MSVYIKGMEMPTTGHITVIEINCLGGVRINGKPIENKAIPVPNHGDLIDRDALPENRMVFDRVKFINERFIKDAPVIIPADTCEEYEDKDGYRDERNRQNPWKYGFGGDYVLRSHSTHLFDLPWLGRQYNDTVVCLGKWTVVRIVFS